MIKFCNLFSGSSGNSTYIETPSTKILVDAGMSCQKIMKALSEIGVSLDEINAILVSHEHSDHIKGIETIVKKFHTPIYATRKTWEAMNQLNVDDSFKNYFLPEVSFSVGDILVCPFSIPHDAVDPCAFNLFHDNKKITIATDLGHLDDSLMQKMYASNLLLLESNYDTETLFCGPYPYLLKKRIHGDLGHLSNDLASKAIKTLYENGTTHFVLGHLSKENNFPELAYQTTLNELKTSSSDLPYTLSIAKRDEIDEIIEL